MNRSSPQARDLEKFIAGPNKPAQFRMRVTLRSATGVLSFNRNCYKQLGRPAAVCLYFSRPRDLIVVEPVQSINLPGAFPVLEKGQSGYRVNAAPFCRHFRIRLDGTVRFPHAEIQSGLLELKLSETIDVSQAKRPRKKNSESES